MYLLLNICLFFLLQPSFASNCENGECVENLIEELNDLHAFFNKNCSPKSAETSDINVYFEKNGLSENCWKILTRISYQEKKLSEIQSQLETKLGCNSPNCEMTNENFSLYNQIYEMEKAKKEMECSSEKKVNVSKNCTSDLKCSLISGALSLGGYAAELLVPEKYQIPNCHYGNDGCLNQIASSFLKSVMLFFKGSWNLLKSAGGYVTNKLSDFWNWVSSSEDHSSTYQLGMAKASEDESFFQTLLNDFPGTISKLWNGLIHAIKDWMKTDIFCSSWSGAPHFSKCLSPVDDFDCISCKAILNGICSISGYIVAEVVPAYITGGLVTIAKHGAQGASKVSRLFRFSPEAEKALKSSSLGKVSDSTNLLSQKISSLKVLNNAKNIVEKSLGLIKSYLISPTREISKKSYNYLAELTKKSKIYLQTSNTGKVIVFSKKALKGSAKAVLYPIDNPMVTFAYKEGQRSLDKLLRLGAPKLADKTTIINNIIAKDASVESILAQMRVEYLKLEPSKSKLYYLELDLLEKMTPIRKSILKESFMADDLNFSDLIENLYPELKYGELARVVGKEKIMTAEKELYEQILFLPEGERRTKLLNSFETHVGQDGSRLEIVKEKFAKPERVEILEGAIMTEGEVEQSLSLTRPILKTAAPAYNQSEEDEKTDKKVKILKIKKALKEGPKN